ncbi:unnamed protein product, partial [Tetraodon nigroviridis]
RWGQTLCPIDAQTAILIGGQGARMQFCKDPIWKLCTGQPPSAPRACLPSDLSALVSATEDMFWVAAETLAEGPTPEARIGHTSVYDPDSGRIFVFGGSKNKKWFNDVHILDTRTGSGPWWSCSLFRGELFVLGGVFPRPNPEPDGCSGSLHIFDPHLSIWYQPIVTGKSPSPRSGHSACVMQERKIYVFGGWDTPVCYNDMYMLDLDTNTWTEVDVPQLSVPRAGHSIITMETPGARCSAAEEEEDGAVSVGRTLLVFGGGDNEGSYYSDLTTVAVEEVLARV